MEAGMAAVTEAVTVNKFIFFTHFSTIKSCA